MNFPRPNRILANRVVALSALPFIALALVGCASRPVHFADAQLVPLFDSSGQVHGQVAYQFEKGLQSQVAVAVTPQWAVHAGATYAQQDNCHSCSKEVSRHVELGAERFRTTANGSRQGLLLGTGLGRFKTLGTDGSWDPSREDIFVSSGKYSSLYVQGHYGKRLGRFDQAASLRFSGFRYFDFQASDGDETPFDYPERHWGLFLEPAYTVRAGYKALQLQGQMGISLPLYQAENLENSRLWFQLGLVLNTTH